MKKSPAHALGRAEQVKPVARRDQLTASSGDVGVTQSAPSRFAHAIDDEVLKRLQRHGRTFALDAIVVACAFIVAEDARYDGRIPLQSVRLVLTALPLTVVVYAVSLYAFGIHRRIWKYAGMPDARAMVNASFLATLVVGIVDIGMRERFYPLSVVLVGGVFALSGLIMVRFWICLQPTRPAPQGDAVRVLIVGAGQAGHLVVSDLAIDLTRPEVVVGFLDDDLQKQRRRVHGLPVLGQIHQLVDIVDDQRIDVVAVAMPSASTRQLDRVLAYAQQTNARIQVLPSHSEVVGGRTSSMQLHDIDLNSLLDRIPSTEGLEGALVKNAVEGRVVLVTGAAGSIGSELCRQLLSLGPSQVVALDNNETGLFHLHQELSAMPHGEILKPYLTSVTAEPKVRQVLECFRPGVVFHAAAYKHVPILQEHADEAVFVNVKGTRNVCKYAREFGCERFVFVSTDKAVDPIGVLGFSKRIGELLAKAHQTDDSVFCSVRFGNVIGSRGSALPEFVRQIDAGGPVTVTHPDVERYFMTIPEAVSLVIQAGALAQGGELFMLDMGTPIKVGDLVKRMIRMRGKRIGQDIEIRYTGLRPGEKLTEDLVFSRERTRPTEIPSIFVVENDEAPDLHDLERRVGTLVQSAMWDGIETVAQQLKDLATGGGYRQLQASPSRHDG